MTDDELTVDDLPQPDYHGTIDIDELEVDGDNPNEMPPERFEWLKNRMLERGWISGPILTDTDGVIADGQHRWEAAKEIGLVEVEVKQYDVDDAGRRLIRQEANKIRGVHDEDSDQQEFDAILEGGYKDELAGLLETRRDPAKVDDILDNEAPEFEPVGSDEQPTLDETDKEQVTCPECFHEFEP